MSATCSMPGVVNLSDWRMLHRGPLPGLHGASPARLCRLAFDLANMLPSRDPLSRKARRVATRLHDAAVFEISSSRRFDALAAHGRFVDTPATKRATHSLTLEEHRRFAMTTKFLEIATADARMLSARDRGKSDHRSRAWRAAHDSVQRLRSDLHSRCFREHRIDGPYMVEVQ